MKHQNNLFLILVFYPFFVETANRDSRLYPPDEDTHSNNSLASSACSLALPTGVIACLRGERREPEESEEDVNNRKGQRRAKFASTRKARSHCQVNDGRYCQEALYQWHISLAHSPEGVFADKRGCLPDQNTSQICHRYSKLCGTQQSQ